MNEQQKRGDVALQVAGACKSAPTRINAAHEWRRPLTGLVLGWSLYESLSGLSIYLLSFSEFNQFSVLTHTVLGLVLLVPVFWYLGQHWYRRFRGNFSHYQLLGYLSAVALIVSCVSGVVLTIEAQFGTRISPMWDLVHVVSSLAFMGLLGAHLLTLIVRPAGVSVQHKLLRAAWRSCGVQTVIWAGLPMAVCVLLTVRYEALPTNTPFPADYSFRYGADRPFAPSLARRDMSRTETAMKSELSSILGPVSFGNLEEKLVPDPSKHEGLVSLAERGCAELSLSEKQRKEVEAVLKVAREAFATQGAIHPRELAGSEQCARCHQQIVDEWLPSAHRYASMDFVFQKVQENMAKELAPEATRYCAGCHDPIALFSGAKNVGNETLSVEGAREGISCLVCHSTVQTDVRGNADYTVEPSDRYLYEHHQGRWAQAISDFLIRAYPKYHVESYSRPLYKTAESCGACHKQFVDAEINDFGWVQGQNQYDSWRKSRWHKEGDVAGTLSCRECHMPLVDSTDPAAGDIDDPNRSPNDGKHRSHRFLGANQFVPKFHKLLGAEEHCRLTEKWLRGEIAVPEIADRWTSGPVIRLSLVLPDSAQPGEEIKIQTIVTNNKAGHDFPTGPLDMIEAWIELTVTDDQGRIVFASSRADDRGYLQNPEIVFKAELIDRLGQHIGKHELWRLVGARFKRALFPGVTDTMTFAFNCPGIPQPGEEETPTRNQSHVVALPGDLQSDTLHVSAAVWYCKYSAPFLDRLFGENAKMRSEVTDVARSEGTIRITKSHHASIQPTP